jgi:hypothetical protein
VRLAADLFASVAWDAAGSAVQAIVPSGDTNSILKAVLKEVLPFSTPTSP